MITDGSLTGDLSEIAGINSEHSRPHKFKSAFIWDSQVKLLNYVLTDSFLFFFSSFVFSQEKPTQAMSSTFEPLWKAPKQETHTSDQEKGEHVL